MNQSQQTNYKPVVIPHAASLEQPPAQLDSPPITSRGIEAATLKRYGIVNPGQPLAIATPVIHYNVIVGWKYRSGGWQNSQDKRTWWAPGSQRWLIGTQLWSGKPCVVYLCEGETDMLVMSQVIPPEDLAVCYGGQPDPTKLASWLDWIDKASYEVRLCFDNDSQGDKYRQEFDDVWQGTSTVVTNVFPPNTSIKDVADLVMVGGEFDWQQFPVLPPTVMTAEQVEEALYAEHEEALSTSCPALDKLIEGYRPGKIILLAGLPKQGKSAFMAWLVAQYIANHKQHVMFFSLELTALETLTRLVAIDHTIKPWLYFINHFGFIDKDFLAKHLKLCKRLGVKMIVIDHVTAAATQYGTEGLTTQAIDGLMYQLQALANELGLYVLAVSHVNAACTGVVNANHLRGSLSLVQVPDVVLGIQRYDNELVEVRTVCPDRVVGQHGKVVYKFDHGVYEAVEYKLAF